MWRFREDDYGVASFTHINVSKYNYCFSDFPFPKDTVEFMHHKHIHDYVRAYADKHDLFRSIVFKTQVILVEEYTDGDEFAFEFKNLPSFDKLWKVTVKDLNLNKEQTYISPYVSVCSGHHSKPRYAEFPGQNTFPGEILHSVRYKNAKFNKLIGKKVCLVGIGNSSVDIADNLITEGRYILL